MSWFIAVANVAGVLIIPTLYPAYTLTGSWTLAPLVAPFFTALCAVAAVLVALATRSPVWPWLLLFLAALNAAPHIRPGLRSVVHERIPATDTWIVALVVIVAALPLLGLQGAGAGWDARSIWLLHARWVLGGGSALAHALGSRVFVFSHPDYPPLVPAVVGSLWRVTGEADLRVGQIAVTELNVCAVALTGLAFVRLLEGRLRFVAALFGGGVCLAAYGFAGVYTVAAYADLLAGAAATAALLYLLVLPPTRANLVTGIALAAVAGLTKNDGAPVALCILVLGGIRHRAEGRWVLNVVGGAAILVVAWPILARLFGARSDLLGGSVVSAPAAPRGHPELGRVPTVLRSLRPLLLHLAEAALFCAVAGAAAARSVRRRLGLGSDIWSWVALIAAAVSLVGAYALTPYDLAWQLGTSVDRTTVGIRIMLVAEVAVWSLLAVTRLTPPAIPEAAPAPPSVAPTEVLVE